MKAGFVISYCLPPLIMMMMMMMFLMCFPNIRPLISPDIRQKYLFHVGPRDFFKARDVCFFLINLSGSRSRLLICSVWTDLNTKIKIFKIRRQTPELSRLRHSARHSGGCRAKKSKGFYRLLKRKHVQFKCSTTRKYKRFSCVNIVRAQFMFCPSWEFRWAVKNLKWFINRRLIWC